MSPTEACTTITSTFGAASRNSVGAIGASMSCRVRGSKRRSRARDGALPQVFLAVSTASKGMMNSELAGLTFGVSTPNT